MAGPIVLASPTMSNPSPDSGLSPNVQGIFWMLTAGLFFSLMVALVKVLGSHFPVAEIPDRYTILGSLIIIASNLLLIFHEGRPAKTGPGERVPGDVT